ncbi:MAG TPA: HNH endonuclease [Bdellovibrionales bacterium]|nr:HNH endonuclease [Bdellovibrionales bacterium]
MSNRPYEFIATADPAHVQREKSKARELRSSQWWKQEIGKGICYHCEQKFPREELTMDHLIPMSRGGRSTKKNIVVACKRCNSLKKNLTTAELRLRELRSKKAE